MAQIDFNKLAIFDIVIIHNLFHIQLFKKIELYDV